MTLEQALFGEADGINTSIEQNTSVGYPWKLKGTVRKDLFDIEKRWISEEFRDAVNTTLKSFNSEVVVLDTLKDERIKLEKVESGDTRVFNIFPVHFNVALKMLFGDFVHYLQQNHSEKPVKTGISPLPDEWTDLHHFLDNGGNLIAGDMSGWDHKCHFEIMMKIISWINNWYDDEYSDIRFELGRQNFEPLHYSNGVIFRARCGMPSGSYLTTAINSLAVVSYFYIFAYQNTGDLGKDFTFWIRPATYGDDHVISVYGADQLNQITFCEWLEEYGVGYTDEKKNKPTMPYTNFNDVTFLKRRFVYREGKWWGPLELENVLQMVQWYRNSSTMRKMNESERCGVILESVLNELFFMGKDIYDREKSKLYLYALQHGNVDVSEYMASYQEKKDLFLKTPDCGLLLTLSLHP